MRAAPFNETRIAPWDCHNSETLIAVGGPRSSTAGEMPAYENTGEMPAHGKVGEASAHRKE